MNFSGRKHGFSIATDGSAIQIYTTGDISKITTVTFRPL